MLSFSSVWGEEIARFCFIYLTWVGASAAVKNRTHIRIDLIYSWVPAQYHVWLYMLADLATMAFAIVAFYYSLIPIVNALSFGNVTDGLRINRTFFLMAVPLGFAMTMMRLVQNFVRDWRDHRAGRPVFRGKNRITSYNVCYTKLLRLLHLDLPPMAILLLIMALIFVLGWPLEWVPIVLIIVPILLPLIVELV